MRSGSQERLSSSKNSLISVSCAGKKPSRCRRVMTRAFVTPRRKRLAAARASCSRVAFPLKTTHVTRRRGLAASSSRTAPPQPISMSSECAPRQRISRSGAPPASPGASESIRKVYPLSMFGRRLLQRDAGRLGGGLRASGIPVPPRPRRTTLRVEFLEALTVLERVHRLPEPVVLVRQQLALGHEPLERLAN